MRLATSSCRVGFHLVLRGRVQVGSGVPDDRAAKHHLESDSVSEHHILCTRWGRSHANPGRRPPRNAARHRGEVARATERLLSDGTPYTELSIQQLCSEAGIARSTFYVYFRDKPDLVARLAEETVAELLRGERPLVGARFRPHRRCSPPRAGLIDLYREHAPADGRAHRDSRLRR